MRAGEIIRTARKSKGLNQTQLAEKVGVSTQAVSQWEKGITRPNVFSAKRLAIELDIERDWLLYDDKIEPIGNKLPKSRFASEYKGLVPVIDIDDAAYFSRNLNFATTKIAAAKELIVPTMPIKGYAFGLRIRNNWLYPAFKTDDIVIISTELFPSDDDYVVAQVEELTPDKSVFGRFVFVGDDPFAHIHVDNEGNDPMAGSGVVGTMVEHRRLRTARSDDLTSPDIEAEFKHRLT